MLKPTCWDAHGSRTIVPAIIEISKRLAGRAAFSDVRAPLINESATGYRYMVVRVPSAAAAATPH